MKKILYELCQNVEFACIYADRNDTSKFIFGTVLAVNDQEIAIQMITPYGKDDGIIVTRLNSIIRVEIESQYVNKMKKLYSKELPIYKLKIKDDNILYSVLLFAFEQEQIISIELLDSGYDDIVGRIVHMDDKKCETLLFNEYGNKDGTSYFCIKEISRISVLSENEKRIMKLID